MYPAAASAFEKLDPKDDYSSDSDSCDSLDCNQTIRKPRLTGISLSGYLNQECHSLFKGWERKYFVFLVDEQVLAYYNDMESAKSQKREGSIDLNDIKSVESLSGPEFELITNTTGIHRLQAVDEHAKTMWIKSLKVIVDVLNSASLTQTIDKQSLHHDIEEGLKNLCLKEGKILVVGNDPNGNKAFDLHGGEIQGKIVSPSQQHADDTDDVIVQKTDITEEGDLLYERKDTTTYKHGDSMNTTQTDVIPLDSEEKETIQDLQNKNFIYMKDDNLLSQNLSSKPVVETKSELRPLDLQ